MPIAAAPSYLGQDFRDASPGMRFGMYLTLWGINRRTGDHLWKTHDLNYKVGGQRQEERVVEDENKVSALRDAARLHERDQRIMRALLQRQRRVFAASVTNDSGLCSEALCTAPFTTGLGNEHPLENGFSFLNPYGLPYLPGSSIKGVMRQAARELARGEWGDTHGWSEYRCIVPAMDDERIRLSTIDALFGLETSKGEKTHIRGALTFWDVIPQIKGDSLMVDIMTPHQSHYYQQKRERNTGDSVTPHDSGQPTPISFLTVPPGSGFMFHVQCDLAQLNRIAPELGVDCKWRAMIAAAFEHAFKWLGFGAKTAVGYGAMREDPKARDRELAKRQAAANEAERIRREAARQADLAQLSPVDRAIREFLDRRQDRNQSELSALLGGLKKDQWSGEEKIAVAERAKAMMVDAKKWKEQTAKKNPDKDYEHQDTLRVMAWIKGQ